MAIDAGTQADMMKTVPHASQRRCHGICDDSFSLKALFVKRYARILAILDTGTILDMRPGKSRATAQS